MVKKVEVQVPACDDVEFVLFAQWILSKSISRNRDPFIYCRSMTFIL